jgi:hypothetical protein
MNAKSQEFITALPEYADKYIGICLDHTKEVATGSGKIVEVKERHIPTIEFFLHIWLPKNLGETIVKSTYYEWMKSEDEVKSNTIKSIDNKFKALAGDIVANEQKGIFYAKNKLGWTDKAENRNENINRVINVEVVKSDTPISSSESDVKLD